MHCETCTFCKRIADGDFEYDSPDAVAFRPRRSGVVEGHMMVVPRIHVDRFDSDPYISGAAMVFASVLAGRLYGENGFNVIVNCGAIAGQTVFHLHIHIIPRRWGDTVTMPWPDSRPVPDVYAEVAHQEGFSS